MCRSAKSNQLKAHTELTPFQWILRINLALPLVDGPEYDLDIRQLMKLLLILAWLRMSWLVSMDITDYIAVIWTPFNEHLIYHCTYQLRVQWKTVTFPGMLIYRLDICLSVFVCEDQWNAIIPTLVSKLVRMKVCMKELQVTVCC